LGPHAANDLGKRQKGTKSKLITCQVILIPTEKVASAMSTRTAATTAVTATATAAAAARQQHVMWQ